MRRVLRRISGCATRLQAPLFINLSAAMVNYWSDDSIRVIMRTSKSEVIRRGAIDLRILLVIALPGRAVRPTASFAYALTEHT